MERKAATTDSFRPHFRLAPAFLERSKQVISNSRGEQVSISDFAKTLLESMTVSIFGSKLPT
jgi:hypothetical protein